MQRVGIQCVVFGVLWWALSGVALGGAVVGGVGGVPESGDVERVVLGSGLEIVVMDVDGGDKGGAVQVWVRLHRGAMSERDDERGAAMIAKRAVMFGTQSLDQDQILELFGIDEQQAIEGEGSFVMSDHMAFMLEVDSDLGVDGMVRVFGFARDLVDGVELSDRAIETARAGVLETIEFVEREQVRSWLRNQWMPELLGGTGGESGFGRVPMPSREQCVGIDADAVRRYVAREWAVGKASVLVVGDVDTQAVIDEARRAFGGLADGEAIAVEAIEVPRIDGRVAVMSHPGLEDSVLGFIWVGESREIVWDDAGYEDMLVLALAGEAMRYRVNRMLRGEFETIRDAKLQAGLMYGRVRFGQMVVDVDGDVWEPVLGAMELERRRLVRDGLSSQEIARGRELLSQQWGYEIDQWNNAMTREKAQIVSWLLASDRPVLDLEEWGRRGPEILAGIDDAAVNAVVVDLIGKREPAVLVLLDSEKKIDESAVRWVLVEARGAEVVAVDSGWIEDLTGPILSRMPVGSVVGEISVHQASGVVSAVLSNGVRVHHREMVDAEHPDQVRVHVRVGFDSVESERMHGVSDVFAEAIDRSLIQSRTVKEVRGIMVEQGIEVEVYLSTLEVEIGMSMPRDSLERSMELAYALLTNLRIEQLLIDEMAVEAASGDVGGRVLGVPVGATEVGITRSFGVGFEMRPGSEFGPDVDPRSVQRWIEKQVVGGSIEVGIAGASDAESAIEICGWYLGAVPCGDSCEETDQGGDVELDPVRGEETVVVVDLSGRSKGGVAVGFGVDSVEGVNEFRALIMASIVIEQRLQGFMKTEGQGQVWTSAMVLDLVPGQIAVMAQVACGDQEVEAWAMKLESEMERFAVDGISAEEFEGAISSIRGLIKDSFERNEFWAGRLAGLGSGEVFGADVESIWSIREGYEGLGLDEIREVFDRWYQDGAHFRVRVVGQD